MNKHKGNKAVSFSICLCAALLVGGRQYYKYVNKHGLFYSISPEWGWLILIGSVGAILLVLGLLILKEDSGRKER